MPTLQANLVVPDAIAACHFGGLVDNLREAMKKGLGLLVGIFLLALAARAFQTASIGWSGGHGDVGFWWTVISCFLGIAGAGALIGTAMHGRRTDG